jgi:hypothetical protein
MVGGMTMMAKGKGDRGEQGGDNMAPTPQKHPQLMYHLHQPHEQLLMGWIIGATMGHPLHLQGVVFLFLFLFLFLFQSEHSPSV